ncbi:hypothetical protein BX661DRAFT_183609 [Kickxella alabastrina]|uniref:uncharacterized protein n=1 Tax=Kickxella alabastrina TaxID=61397 RepID=UPI00221F5A2D|nr:uncharacterized protein BX661DRAFT_183609 [Kickxella alabastrina]KAI7826846.1 hypothetical protein BX661DRAFT_183609 [Kickxella alabastrina]
MVAIRRRFTIAAQLVLLLAICLTAMGAAEALATDNAKDASLRKQPRQLTITWTQQLGNSALPTTFRDSNGNIRPIITLPVITLAFSSKESDTGSVTGELTPSKTMQTQETDQFPTTLSTTDDAEGETTPTTATLLDQTSDTTETIEATETIDTTTTETQEEDASTSPTTDTGTETDNTDSQPTELTTVEETDTRTSAIDSATTRSTTEDRSRTNDSLQTTTSNSSDGSNSSQQSTKSSRKLSGGAIAGIVIGVVAFVVIVIAVVLFFYYNRRKNKRLSNQLEFDHDFPQYNPSAPIPFPPAPRSHRQSVAGILPNQMQYTDSGNDGYNVVSDTSVLPAAYRLPETLSQTLSQSSLSDSFVNRRQPPVFMRDLDES